MFKAFWAPLWHIYQPPIQTKEWLLRITEESYRQIIKLYKEHPSCKFTLNINASLTLLLQEHELTDVIEGFKELAERGQLEFVGTTAYHTLCPLLPEKEIMRQIKLNDKINRKAFGKSYKPKGFWLPEMAYAPSVTPSIAKAGYNWIMLAGVASNGNWSNKGWHIVKHGKYQLKAVFRDDFTSINIGFGKANSNFIDNLQKGTFCFTALDGETIGHHVKSMVIGMKETLDKIEKRDDIDSISVGEIFELFECLGEIEALPSSWSTTYEDIREGNFFPLWLEKIKEPFKSVHELAWNHLYLTINATHYVKKKVNGDIRQRRLFEKARELVDKSEHSCMYWWFTRDDWHRDVVRFLVGLELQNNALITLQNICNDEKMKKLMEEANQLRENIYKILLNS
ncbi:MAG: hypothetical protein NZ893_01275 [Candidatus Aenigmarchaeota archaeon]|nr:hypothetical protein [Candidatus Aenigmarchaeota archaeon]